MEREPDGMSLRMPSGELHIQVLGDAAVRVAFSASPDFFSRVSIARVPLQPQHAPFQIIESKTSYTLVTDQLRVSVDRQSGAVSFADHAGHALLAEAPGGRMLDPATVQGEQTFHVQQKWHAADSESLYGLGQMQLGTVDIKGYDLDLWQHNTNVVVPFLVSSKGYGIFWDNTSFTRFGDLRPFTTIPAADLYDAEDNAGRAHADFCRWGRAAQPDRGYFAAPACAARWVRRGPLPAVEERVMDRLDPRSNKRRVSVPRLLEWRHQGVARRQNSDGPLEAELAHFERSDSRAS